MTNVMVMTDRAAMTGLASWRRVGALVAWFGQRMAGGDRRDQHLAAGKPKSRIDDEVANCPGLVVEIKILHFADGAIGGADG